MSVYSLKQQKDLPIITSGEVRDDYFIAQSCLEFDASIVRGTIRNDSQGEDLDWGECISSAYESSKKLEEILKPYYPTYCIVYAQGSVNGAPSGHVWLQTEVCHQTYLTDLVGGGFYAQNFGFGGHYFDLIQDVFESGYARFKPTVLHCSEKALDIESDEAWLAYDKAQDILDDAREVAGTLTAWEAFIRWLKK